MTLHNCSPYHLSFRKHVRFRIRVCQCVSLMNSGLLSCPHARGSVFCILCTVVVFVSLLSHTFHAEASLTQIGSLSSLMESIVFHYLWKYRQKSLPQYNTLPDFHSDVKPSWKYTVWSNSVSFFSIIQCLSSNLIPPFVYKDISRFLWTNTS